MAEVFKKIQNEWELFIRLHPHDNDDAIDYIRKKLGFLGKSLIILKKQNTILEDCIDKDFACTGSSSAIYFPLLLGIPSYLIWHKSFNLLHGGPFLNKSNIANNAEDLIFFIKNIRKYRQNNLDYAKGHLTSDMKAFKRIKFLLKNNVS
ncbi:unnamed protein product [marine sediment metagenome]|uniref:Uncharacterized protein n=1 Tax=marine sediment metagenome TaxID=412755 RepID=X1GGR2_9ZZZZ